MNRPLKIVLVIFLILIIGFLSFLLFRLIFATGSDTDKILTGILSFFTALIPLAIKELREVFTNEKEVKDSQDYEAYDIFVYGHSGSGKTTLIQRLFTFDLTPLETTSAFDYYETPIPLNLKSLTKKDLITIRIADYKGQDVNQILDAAKINEKINTLLLIADVAPAYSKGNSLSEDNIYNLFKENHQHEIVKRLRDHEKYLSEFLLQVVFKDVYNPYLKSVRLIINKCDILEKLKNDKIIPVDTDIDEYAKSFFKEIISHIEQFCNVNDITDFQVITVSATHLKNIKEMFSVLLEKFIKTKQKIDYNNGK